MLRTHLIQAKSLRTRELSVVFAPLERVLPARAFKSAMVMEERHALRCGEIEKLEVFGTFIGVKREKLQMESGC